MTQLIQRKGSIGYTISPMDYSTISLRRMMWNPLYKLPPTYQLASEPGGLGGAMDPPGFPSHMVWGVYTQYGNTPHRGPEHVIVHPDDQDMLLPYHIRHENGVSEGAHQARLYRLPDYPKTRATLRRLWVPIPYAQPDLSDPASQGVGGLRLYHWMQMVYSHYRTCYRHPTKINSQGNPDIFFWKGEEIPDELDRFVSPENHSAVHLIREFYPQHKPIKMWIDNPKSIYRSVDNGNNRWWETTTISMEMEIRSQV